MVPIPTPGNIRNLVTQTLLSFRVDKELTPEDVTAAREYIKAYWKKVKRFHPKDDESLLGLPNPYIVPSYRTRPALTTMSCTTGTATSWSKALWTKSTKT